MRKLFAMVCAGAVFAFMSGCGVNNPSTTKVNITIEEIGAVVVGGASGAVKGSIEADSIITNVTMIIKDNTGATLSNVTANFTSGYSGKESADLESDMATTIKAVAGASGGTDTLVITASAGSVSTSSSKAFTVTGGTASDLTLDTAKLGNTQNATAGTIDLDNGTTYTHSDVTASNVGNIDLCFAYSTSGGGVDRFYVPKAAKYGTEDNKTIKTTAAGFAFTSSWPSTGYSETVRINTITSAQYDATTTKTAAAALWNAGNALVYAPVAATGDAFLVKTSAGATVLIKVLAYTAGTSGTVEFKYAK